MRARAGAAGATARRGPLISFATVACVLGVIGMERPITGMSAGGPAWAAQQTFETST